MNRKDIIQLSITGILIIVLGVLAIRMGKGKGRGKNKTDSLVFLSEISYEQIVSGEIAEKRGLYARLEEETENLKPRRNPFSKQHLASISGPYLNGIFWDRKNPTAIINNQIVGNGSRINDYTVIEIKRDAVILMEDASRTEYRLELYQ